MLYSKQTVTYKKIQGCELQADVYVPQNKQNKKALLWLHPGGLVLGNRTTLLAEQIELYIKLGYTIIAADYRLAPETKLKEILGQK